jgi:hypothetical protein
MAADPFSFLRGTFYRWVPLWEAHCPALDAAPQVLGVGDLHVENFGTWRDTEGRLVWGVNDFDEAAQVPYTFDLVRLATSALLVARRNRMRLTPRAICAALLEGYGDGLARGGAPFVLEENHPTLRSLALSADRDPGPFWKRLSQLPDGSASPAVRRLLADRLPAPALRFRIARRTAGVGSLGRPRLVAIAAWAGGLAAREVKALLPSAYDWARGRTAHPIRIAQLLARAVRCPDPTYAVIRADGRAWAVRRLAPHCARIALGPALKRHDERRLLLAMGAETANLHLGTATARRRLLSDLGRRDTGWLHDAAHAMAGAVEADWKAWSAR